MTTYVVVVTLNIYRRDLRIALAGAPSLLRIFTGRQIKSYLPGFTFVRSNPSMIHTPAPSKTWWHSTPSR
jgi:hypothetical protein